MADRPSRDLKTPRERGLLFGDEQPLLAPFVIALACLLPFLPGLSGPFLLDDLGNIEQLLGARAEPRSIYAAIFHNESGLLLRPVSNLTLVANLLTAGPFPFAFKLTNLAIHLANSLLVFGIALSLLRLLAARTPTDRRIATALLAAAIWTAHPLQVSTVLYVIQRMTMLSAAFSLVAIGIALSFLLKPDTVRRTHWLPAAVLFLLATSLATLSKENGALTPVLLLAILLSAPPIIQRSLVVTRERKRFWLATVGIPIALGAVAAVALWDRLTGYGNDLTMLQRVLTQPFVLAGYLRSFLLPDPRHMGLFLDDTRVHDASEPLAWIALALVLAMPLVAIAIRRRWPVAAFAILWFLGCHALESTIIPLEMAFEHRNYLALLGPSLLVAHGIAALATRGRAAATSVGLVVVLGLGYATYQRSIDWSSEASFALAEAAHHPDSIRAQNLAAIVERKQGGVVSPVRRMQRMKALHPDAFFPFAMDMDFACDIPGHEIDWRAIQRNAADRLATPEVLGFFNHTTIQVANGRCPGIPAAVLDGQLRRLADAARHQRAIGAAQYFIVLRATLRERATPGEAAELMYAAAALDPTSAEVWQRIAIFEMDRGDAARALAAIDNAAAGLAPWSPRAVRLEQLRKAAAAITLQPAGTRVPASTDGPPT